MSNKKMYLATAALVLVMAILAGVYFVALPETNTTRKTVTVTVVHGDGSEKVCEYVTNEEYLGTVILENGLVEGEFTEYGLMIHAVDGEPASWEENQSYWRIVVGDEDAITGADGVALTDGGQYSLVYTIG